MPSILNNVTAMTASRQIGVSQMGLRTAIERLTTGKRINRASDDAAGMASGSAAEALARTAKEAVKGYQVSYFEAQASDAYLEEATNLAYRLSELEGSGNGSSDEATSIKGLITAAVTKSGTSTTVSTATASTALANIATARSAFASQMATANSNANMKGIEAENQFSISDTWMGADIGAEMVNLTKFQIMVQSGTSALSNANQSSQFILGLFR